MRSGGSAGDFSVIVDGCVTTAPNCGVAIRPCPALLLQELRTTSAYIVAESEVETIKHEPPYETEVETIKHEPPYETRAVFADHEDGVLHLVDEVSNFVRALGPGEDGPPKSSHPGRRPRPRRQA